MLIVDAQIHIWKSSKPNPNHRQIADYSADDALKEMDEAGVTAAVIHPPGWDPNANALAVEAARDGIRVHAISPSYVLESRTAELMGSARMETAAKRAGLGLPTAADIAPITMFLCGPGAAKITGQVISVNGGLNA